MIIGVDGNEANVNNRVGSNEYSFEILNKLWELGDQHQWIIYLRNSPSDELPKEKENWHYQVIGPKKFWTQFALPLELFFSSKKLDVFFSTGHYTPRWSPVPVVASIMDLGYLDFPEQFKSKDYYQLKLWTARTINSASHLFAISESTKNDIIKKYHIAENKITVTHLGFDNKRFKTGFPKEEIEEIKSKYKISSKYFLFLGTLKPSKNIEGLINAYKIWKEKNKGKEIKLVIAGKKGWLFESIFEKVKGLKLEEDIVFTDFVDQTDVPTLIGGSEVFVLPSFWEGFGIPALEAMACGTPVVVSNIASLPEVVGEAGILVNPKEPESISEGLSKALENKKSLIEKGLMQTKKFSWNKCAEKTLEILEHYEHV